MSVADDADRLGPKGHVYIELVREQWRAPLERGTARRALLTGVLAVALIVFGIAGTFIAYGESLVLVGIGAFALWSTIGEVKALRPEFEEARRIGWVEPSLDDSRVTVGEPATFRAVLHARRELRLQNAAVVAEAHAWQGAAQGERLLQLPLPVSLTGGTIRGGDDWRQAVTFRLPATAPPSFYDATSSVRWTITLDLTFADQGPWRRTWPMLVYPADQG
jgi:hypothetical protein